MKSNQGQSVRYRVCVSRLGEARNLTHLAQIELLRRAVLASGLPAVMDKRRKRPRPKLAFGPAISKGYESLAEYFDLELTSRASAEEVWAALGETLSSGFAVTKVRRIPRYFPSLDASINVVRYVIRGTFPKTAQASLERLLSSKEIVVQKIKDGGARIEKIDARPLIIQMTLSSPCVLRLTLRFGPKRTVKPEALLGAWVPEWKSPEALSSFNIMREELLSETLRGELIAP